MSTEKHSPIDASEGEHESLPPMREPLSSNSIADDSIFVPADWSLALDSIAAHTYSPRQSVTVICGPKNSGKSTFSRCLVNLLLRRYKRVGYLDTDVGQPEFTAPGFLSFTVIDKPTNDISTPCIKNPERCLFFGDLSAKRSPSIYLKSVKDLYDYYQSQYDFPEATNLPLVVNTSGWVKGVGYDVLVEILRYMAPISVVKLNTFSGKKNLPDGTFWMNNDHNMDSAVFEINSVENSHLSIRKNASLLRDLRIMAYFRQCFLNNIDTIKELAHALAAHRPYQVPYSSLNIINFHCQIPEAEKFYSLNATIVGLAVSSDKSSTFPWCLGLGIVRSVDPRKKLLYIMTPVSSNLLKNVDTLIQGFINIPTCLLQVQGCISPYMSTNVIL